MSEAITNHLSQENLKAYSAGSQPVGEVHPLSIKYLQARGISTQGLKSQSWDEFESINPDVVVTVCDSAANESCPVWFGQCIKIHWGLPDPSKLEGTEDEIRNAFFAVMDTIEVRTKKILAVDFEHMNKADLKRTLISISEE